MEFSFSDDNKSSYHKKVISFLREQYPLFDISQERSVHIDGHTLQFDISIKSPIKACIEINPTHHYKFVPHFHQTIDNFKAAQHRDKLKKVWAKMNDCIYIELKEDDFKKNKFKEILKEVLE